ncbi:MAG TPA: glycosyltransferase family 39 protein [Candidatus Sulfotelmatobacter sp.]|nr:glycosyltransferase family 39 protein [Candidatus Sulfotelmatobacter sp.]
MASANVAHRIEPANDPAQGSSRGDTFALLAVVVAVAIVHVLTNGRYGFHRDELQVLSDARHLDWGFVPYPPFTPFMERIGLSIFGVSMVGLRMFSTIANAAAIFFTGLMARELGGGRLAQVTAALAIALSPLPLFEGTEFQYTTFDYLWWVLIAYFIIRLLKTENPRWWLAIGATIGIGFMTKYTMGFYLAGILGGLVLTRARRYLVSGWFWGGMALGLAICLPNVLWQVKHGFISLQFLQHIHQRDVAQGRTDGYWRDQFMICTNPFAAPLWIAGLIGYLLERRYRMLGWMYLIPLVLYAAGKGRGYYLGGAYPMLMAMGSAMGAAWLASMSKLPRRAIATVFFAGLAFCGAYIAAVVLPLTSSGPLKDFTLKNNSDLREEIGWDDYVKAVAAVRDALPPEEQVHVGVAVWNYGEQGAIEILGTAYHLPPPISGTNSAWLRGYPEPPPTTLIVTGTTREGADHWFTSCRLAGHNGNAEGIQNEESRDHPDIYVCGPPRLPWPEFWKQYLAFG